MYLKAIFTVLLVAATLVCANPGPNTYEKNNKLIIHDEAIIPTHTVTQTQTQTATVTQTEIRVQSTTVTQTKNQIATVTPKVSIHTLRENEAVPAIPKDTKLVKKIVVDVTVDDTSAYNTSGSNAYWRASQSSNWKNGAMSDTLSLSVCASVLLMLVATLLF